MTCVLHNDVTDYTLTSVALNGQQCYVQLSLVAQGILQAKIENFSIFFQIPKSHMAGQYTAQDTIQTIF